MNKKPLKNLSFLYCIGLLVSPLNAQTFWESGAPSGITTTTIFLQDTSFIGGELDVEVNQTIGDEGYLLGKAGVTTLGHFSVSRDSSFSDPLTPAAVARFSWDGIDGNATLDSTGLGAIDLASSYQGISFSLGKDGPATSWIFDFYTDATNYSSYTISLPQDVGSSNFDYDLLFSDFTLVLGSGADFSNIGAIQITNVGDIASDTNISNLVFMPVPEPSGAFLVAVAGILAGFGRRSRKKRRGL